ncbi:hypothetical protein CBR_g48131 [Chara braunii]|uniref:Uncharacterized protein n=1 Tax=Chara braunii TaxID=69332 RepID=A0A388M222_CHABU|nr:hypothetical protein CBR_g48131 [Chara braunii]|eukprot:GBG88601.1 hypothetical protein CBR_g48131 [Chara braunii]
MDWIGLLDSVCMCSDFLPTVSDEGDERHVAQRGGLLLTVLWTLIAVASVTFAIRSTSWNRKGGMTEKHYENGSAEGEAGGKVGDVVVDKGGGGGGGGGGGEGEDGGGLGVSCRSASQEATTSRLHAAAGTGGSGTAVGSAAAATGRQSQSQNGNDPRGSQLGKHRHVSMMEQLVPEITYYALSYLDYKSLCSVSMTNSSMRRAANDDNAWKALYHKDFTLEQDKITPFAGWKAHYALTKAVIEANEAFYNYFRAKSVRGMARIWLDADYVKCIHNGGQLVSGYSAVIERWRTVFSWTERFDFVLRDVRPRVMGDVAWVTLKKFVNGSVHPILATNCFELHNKKWYIVHHHSSPQLDDRPMEEGFLIG